jgi:hypothetical protein
MSAKVITVIIAGLTAATIGSFLGGRQLEISHRLEAIVPAGPKATRQPISAPHIDYQQLDVHDIIKRPFAQFYDALRFAPPAARNEWARELQKMPDTCQKTAALRGYYKLLAQLDPDAAIRLVAESQDPTALEAVIGATPQSALPQLAEMIYRLPSEPQQKAENGEHDDYPSLVLSAWSQLDPAAVAHFIDDHENDPSFARTDESDRFQSERGWVLQNWTAVDPEAAKAWADRLGDKLPKDALADYVYGWLCFDRSAGIDYTLHHATDPVLKDVVSAIGADLFDESPDNALAFIKKLPTSEMQRNVASEIARHCWYAALEDPTDTTHASRSVGEWLLTLPPEFWKEPFSNLIPYWPEGPQDFCSWIQQLPPQTRDTLVGEFAVSQLEDLEKSAEAAFEVTNPRLQEQLLMALLRNVHEADEEIVKTIQQSNLTTDQKRRLSQGFQQIISEREPYTPPADSGDDSSD